jgi:hypothetical protein
MRQDRTIFHQLQDELPRKRWPYVVMGILLVVYLSGIYLGNELVRNACNRPKCEHGWTSKKTKTEQAIARYWR